MKRLVLVAAVVLSAVASAGQNMNGVWQNGAKPNGAWQNGVRNNGIWENGQAASTGLKVRNATARGGRLFIR